MTSAIDRDSVAYRKRVQAGVSALIEELACLGDTDNSFTANVTASLHVTIMATAVEIGACSLEDALVGLDRMKQKLKERFNN